MKCAYCGAEFIPARPYSLYCKRGCAYNAWRKRQQTGEEAPQVKARREVGFADGFAVDRVARMLSGRDYRGVICCPEDGLDVLLGIAMADDDIILSVKNWTRNKPDKQRRERHKMNMPKLLQPRRKISANEFSAAWLQVIA